MEEDEVGAYVDAVSRVVDLPIPAAYRQGVIDNLQAILRQTAGLMAVELDPAEESAPIFHP
ncbi:MAG: DUF4089 domain-containing protein [Hyphomonadaceae bacterium]|nr:DUF4089 domain-containing protein [Hyphomonadaceae bacterium]